MKKCYDCGRFIAEDEAYWMDALQILCIHCAVAKGLIPKSKEA